MDGLEFSRLGLLLKNRGDVYLAFAKLLDEVQVGLRIPNDEVVNAGTHLGLKLRGPFIGVDVLELQLKTSRLDLCRRRVVSQITCGHQRELTSNAGHFCERLCIGKLRKKREDRRDRQGRKYSCARHAAEHIR